MFTNSPYPCHTGCGRNSQISPPSISCTFEFDRSTPWTFYPPHIYLPNILSPLSQSGQLFPSFSTLIHRHIYSFLYFHTYLSVHHLSTLSPYAASSDSSIHQQTYFSKHARVKTYCLKYSLPPATLSLSLPRRRLGRTPLVAVLLFFSCRIRALFFLLCSPHRF